MKKPLKRMLSCLLALCMSVSLGTMNTVADTTDASGDATGTETVRTLTIDYWGLGSAPGTSSAPSASLDEKNKDNQFWVGVAVDNVQDLDLFHDGVYSLEIAFEYNPNYVVPYFTGNDMNGVWNQALIDGNLGDANTSLLWDKLKYQIVSEAETGLDTVTDREYKELLPQRTDWKMCTVCVTASNIEQQSDLRFYGLDSTEKQYLLRLPFKLVAAPTDGTNPTVLSLVRGPETFNIGSGSAGKTPFSAWEATVLSPDDAENMKTLFTSFTGDISLFGSGGAIESIVPVKPATDTTPAQTYTLSHDKVLLEMNGFHPLQEDYYLSVPNDVSTLQLQITAATLPKVVANGTELTPLTVVDKLYTTPVFSLTEIVKPVSEDVDDSGFDNTVTVEADGLTYTIHIRRLMKPKLNLNYGNTPAGMIWSNDDDYPTAAEKEAAVIAFQGSRLFEEVSPGLYYYDAAWTSYKGQGEEGADYNGDDDKEAIVVFNRKAFRDVGFTAINAFGEKASGENVSIELEMTAFGNGNGGVPMYDDTTDQARAVTATASGNNYLFTEFQNYDIRPDVYPMTYRFTDDSAPGDPVTVVRTRKVIAVSPRGDVEINAFSETSSADASEVTKNVANFMSTKISSLFKFRVADVDTNTFYEISSADASEITKQVATGIDQFYNELPDTALPSTDTSTGTDTGTTN